MPPQVSVSGGEGRGAGPRGESWPSVWSGERASLLSSSNDELSPVPLGKSVSGEGGGGPSLASSAQNRFFS